MDKIRELLPCPFCGCQDINGPHQQKYVGDTYSPSWWAECGKCPVFIEVEGRDRSALITAWNMRAQSAAVPVVQPLTPELATLAYQRAFAESDRVDFSLRIARHVAVLLMPIGAITAAELDALRKDAERYNYVRERVDMNDVAIAPDPEDIEEDYPALFDNFIDAAIAGEKKGKENA